ncbi:MAG: deoxyribonuclease IV [Solirubrobacterales bacterium]
MMNIGCHLSSSKGYRHMGLEALSIGANTFQYFSRNPRGSKAKDIDLKDINQFLEIMKDNKFPVILAHAPYTMNPCSNKEGLRGLAQNMMAEDLATLEYLPGTLYNFHPGSHVGQGVETGIEYITKMLNNVLRPEQKTMVLLETMAGKGSEVGSKFEELKEIINGVNISEKLGVCLDTCHVYDSGYDIVSNLDGVLDEFDKIIGLERLLAIHLNDSLNQFGSHKDRHACIGKGNIGLEAVKRIINHPKLRKLPFYLETPNDLEGYAEEIKLLRNEYKEGL